VLDHIRQHDDVETLAGFMVEEVFECALEHLVTSGSRERRSLRIGLDADEAAVGSQTPDLARVGTGAGPDVEHAGPRPVGEPLLEQLQERAIRALDVGVTTCLEVQRVGRARSRDSQDPPEDISVSGSVARQHPSDEIHPALAAVLGRPESVLEVGSGSGVHGMLCRRAGARVTGLEPVPELAVRAARVLDEVHAVDPLGSEAEAVLGERRFELVLIPDLLERTPDPDALIRRYARYVAPEGRLIAASKNKHGWPVRLGLANSRIGYATVDGRAPRLHSRADVTRLLESAGLEVLSSDFDPMLLKALRGALSEDTYLSARADEDAVSGFRDWSPYQAYLDYLRPLEVALTRPAGELLAFTSVVVARRKPKPGPLSLTVGMLTMDEEPSCARMIEAIRKYAPDAKILCVDSSLRDRTPVIAAELGARVVRQLPPRGHGPAMELLMREAAAESDALIYLDCDFTYPPELIPRLRAILEDGVDVVNAARTRTRPSAMPLANYAANKTFVYLARLLNGMPVADLHSGMRGYRASTMRAFAFDGEGDALPIDTLLWPARSGYHVVEIPIDYQERVGQSKLRKVAGTVWTFIRLAKTLQVGERRGDTYDAWPSAESAKS
jgi:SAM-dependent methyltransferase